ncbi:hypothetical protein [Krasilnikovia sp. M28-CT-15]|uniref:hypothetical protein n=1 Tax=Krasilnikovia sp. M28-CT-15 TaxID=3373540 RepID=UPI003875C1B3
MELWEFLDHLQRRPGMWGLDGSFGQYAAFLEGYGTAEGRALEGWREWLVVQLDGGNNLGWQGLVHRLALPDWEPGYLPLDEVQDKAVVVALFRLLNQFVAERESGGGALSVKAVHQAWMERQSWYRPQEPS